MRGYALAVQRPAGEGASELAEALTEFRATGADVPAPFFFGSLAETLALARRFADALAAACEGISLAETIDNRWWLAELYRLKGTMMLRCSKPAEEAEAALRHAIELARGQKARSLELRAVTSLSRLLQEQGKKDEARRMLAEIYGWFTEGFDTADLKDGQALLEELS